MKIAVTYDNGNVFQHFGHTEFFKLYDVENGKIIKTEIVSTAGAGHGALGNFLKDHQVETLICGGIGGGAKKVLGDAGISLYAGISGSCDDAANALAAGTLHQDAEANCDHHDHDHGDHSCGSGVCH